MAGVVKTFFEFKAVSWTVAFLLSIVVRFIYLVSRVEYRGCEKLQEYIKTGKPVIIVFWHSRALFLSNFWRTQIGLKKSPIYGIFSGHRDGQLIARVFKCLGVGNVIISSGSTSQASSVVMRLMRLLRQGKSIGFTPDGPIGPRMTFVSDSPLLFAKMSGAPIVPMYVSSEKPKLLNSWDRFMVLKPFKKTVVEVDDLFFVDKKITDKDLKKLKSGLEKRMVEKSMALDKEMGMPVIAPGLTAKVRDAKYKK